MSETESTTDRSKAPHWPNKGVLIDPDDPDPLDEFEERLQQLIFDGEDAGLTIDEMHNKMVKVHEDNV